MPIAKRWSRYARERVREENDVYGAYELGNRRTGEVLYIGSGRIRSRLRAHFPGGTEPKPGVSGYRVDDSPDSQSRARGRERSFLFDFRNEHGRLPKFNDRIPPPL